MAEARATVTPRRRIARIWLVPIVALVLGLWMVIHDLRSRGPEVTIVFSSGEGLEVGKTKVKVRSVEVGLVDTLRLNDDLESVVVTTRLDKVVAPLLREDTQFWVVRPRIGPEGISGVGTLLSGGFIQLAPGSGKEGRRRFVGLDVPPVTPTGTPGLRVQLVSDRTGSVGSGNPVLYKGFRVGRIESSTFDVATQGMHYSAFIEAPYDELVTSATRFWNASGISLSATSDGIDVQMASLEALLVGGVTFGLPDGVEPGGRVESGASFDLYPSHASVSERPYRHGVEYVVRFARSVRGLKPDAAVEYRGIRVGHVERILLRELSTEGLIGEGEAIPVLMRLEPGRLGLPDSEAGTATLSHAVTQAIGQGMRATLATGSLLTGSLYVSLNVYPDEPLEETGPFAGRPTIPAAAGGLEAIEHRVTALLDKLNALPLDVLLDRVDGVLANLNVLLRSDGMRALPQTLDATLADLGKMLESVSADSALQERLTRTMTELNRTLRSLRVVLETLEEKPNALIFPRDPPPDPEPQAGTP
jgi:paraquat-inducible protein B